MSLHDITPKDLTKESVSLQDIIEQLALHEIASKLIKIILASYNQTITKSLNEELLDGWDEVDELKGTKIRISSGKETITGKASGIDREGNLLVKIRNGRFKKVHSGR